MLYTLKIGTRTELYLIPETHACGLFENRPLYHANPW